jgi:hypothetical protein
MSTTWFVRFTCRNTDWYEAAPAAPARTTDRMAATTGEIPALFVNRK